ncbi:MAG: bifunctional DNA-formamidopyrimidine glycosylase/DNA-(apurinic or apyrimidinic site) lyase [Nevskia sp.]|nr:bifunctional DNA-formamidopyrimidine glycosylase/DNA-(apurinic or apyrimidinic site) lyase [Nevskia sp.]
MPELPEVETIRRGIEAVVLGRIITAVTVRDARLRWPIPPDFAAFAQGKRIVAVARRGKYLIFDLGGDRLIVHLGMSGRLYVVKGSTAPRKHDHVDLELADDRGDILRLRFHDPRRFGAVLPWPAAQAEHPLIQGMGPEPFGDAFSGEYLFLMSRGRSAPVKNFVMDGRIVVGVGNIYASEALFRAGIRPHTAAGRITRARYARLAETILEVLRIAIEHGGTTLRDFANAQGESGYFQQELMVYGRADEACRVCKTAIRRLVIGQRSSFYCPTCQH